VRGHRECRQGQESTHGGGKPSRRSHQSVPRSTVTGGGNAILEPGRGRTSAECREEPGRPRPSRPSVGLWGLAGDPRLADSHVRPERHVDPVHEGRISSPSAWRASRASSVARSSAGEPRDEVLDECAAPAVGRSRPSASIEWSPRARSGCRPRGEFARRAPLERPTRSKRTHEGTGAATAGGPKQTYGQMPPRCSASWSVASWSRPSTSSRPYVAWVP